MKNLEEIFSAIDNNDFDSITNLISNGININSKSSNGFTPLMYAIEENKIDVISFLLKNGADVNYKASNNWTPLIYAVSLNNKDIASLLLNNGADIYLEAVSGGNALTSCIIKSNENAMKLLVYEYKKNKRLNYAKKRAELEDCKNKSIKMFAFLLGNCPNVNYELSDGTTALGAAKYSLLFNEMAVYSVFGNSKSKKIKELTNFIISIAKEMIDLLIAQGADENYVNKFGETPESYGRNLLLRRTLKLFENRVINS